MNCKPGDLAVYVGGNDVKVTNRLNGESHFLLRPGLVVRCAARMGDHSDAWLIEPQRLSVVFSCGNRVSVPLLSIRDAYIRPIRDQDGEDETLTWAGKPEGVTA